MKAPENTAAPQLFTAQDYCNVGGKCTHVWDSQYMCSALHEAKRAQAKFAQWYQSYQTDADKRIAELEKALEKVILNLEFRPPAAPNSTYESIVESKQRRAWDALNIARAALGGK